jgi:hypothetical protein
MLRKKFHLSIIIKSIFIKSANSHTEREGLGESRELGEKVDGVKRSEKTFSINSKQPEAGETFPA